MQTKHPVTRRTVIKAAGTVGAISAVGMAAPFVIPARAGDAIKLGVLLPSCWPLHRAR